MREPCETCVDFMNCRTDDVHHRYRGSGPDCWTPKQPDEIQNKQVAIKEHTNDFNERLAKALTRAGQLEGIRGDKEFGIVIAGGNMNDYLLVGYLARLIKDGQCEIKVAPNKIEYLFKLLDMKTEGI